MSSEIALRLDGIAKCYTIRHQDHDHITLAQSALHRIRHPRGRTAREEFWALRDVSLEVSRGEILGVVGHNGAGKSTLLKILSRITPPTRGRVEVFGRIGSLLEVGTGFHPELTGRENVYLNGAILGMRKKEIDEQFDAIVDFSGVEQFLDTPVKRYSSGMYVRLAFAVAAHLRTEILLLDEVLAVGDPDFQQRSVAQIRRLARDGRTVLFVSHNRELVAELTSTAVALSKGVVVDRGPTDEVLERRFQRSERVAGFHRGPRYGRSTRFDSAVATVEPSVDSRFRIVLELEVSSDSGCSGWRPNYTLQGPSGGAVGSTFGPTCRAIASGGRASVVLVSEPLPLAPGAYSIDMSLSVEESEGGSFEMVDLVLDACTVSIPETREGSWPADWGAIKFGTQLRPESTALDMATAVADDFARLET